MKIHWRTEDRWLREFTDGRWPVEMLCAECPEIDDVLAAIRRAIRRRERRGKK